MPRLAAARAGQRLLVKGRQIEFSFWPTRPGRLHYGLQTRLFALDPWAIIRQSVELDCPKARRREALACLEQGRDFYEIGTGRGIEAARPLALYYSYMNLVKAFCLTGGNRATFDRARHGLIEQLGAGGRELVDAYLDAAPSLAQGKAENFDEFMRVLTGAGLQAQSTYSLPALLPQILSGHRLWAQAARREERFIVTQDIQLWHEPAAHEIWLRIYLKAEDLTRFGISHRRLLDETRLGASFREITTNVPGQVCLEQIATQHCPNHYPADHLHHLVAAVRPMLWMTVSTVPPYRRYYLYLSPPAERATLLPQLLSMYAITFYLGSITRYRPHHFDALLKGSFGPRIRDFVTGQPLQFLYQMASEMAKRDVARPSIL